MIIEEIRIQNFKALKNVHLQNLPAMAVFIGENGSGKSTLFHVFSFLLDCLRKDVKFALEREGGLRGFPEVITRGVALKENIRIEIEFRAEIAGASRLVGYALEIGLDENKPVVKRETLGYFLNSTDGPLPLIDFSLGKGSVINNELEILSSDTELDVQFHSIAPDTLALASLGLLERFRTAKEVRGWIAGWEISDFQTRDARGRKIRADGERLSGSGENLSSVAYRLQQEAPEVFRKIVETMRRRLPGVGDIAVEVGPDGGLYLRFSERAFDDAFLDLNVSDGTLRLFAYLLLLNDPSARRFLIVEEPENQLHPELMHELADDFQSYADEGGQVFVSTHSTQFLNAVELDSLFLFRKTDGISRIYRLRDDPLTTELIRGGDHPGYLWSQGLFAGVEHRIASGS
jgi:predicted ATPase